MERRYKWGYKKYRKMSYFKGQNGEKVYSIVFSNLESETENGEKPSLHTGWDEAEVIVQTNTPKRLIRAACSEFRTEKELREFVGAINRTVKNGAEV